MKKTLLIILLYTLFQASGSLYGVGEKTLILGAASTWSMVESRSHVAEITGIRPNPVLVLSSARPDDPTLDLALSFDESTPGRYHDRTGHYRVKVSPQLAAAPQRWARAGTGAALFSGNAAADPLAVLRDEGPLVLEPRGREALLSPSQHLKDFSLEFWLYPMNMENGEQILSWASTRSTMQGAPVFQRIQCVADRNRLRWNFLDFFGAPDDGRQLSLTLTSSAPVLPKVWGHHLIRFDADTGMLEYLVNGSLEGIVYATSSGREGGEVFSPTTGEGGQLILGGRFTGLIDEFMTWSRYVETPMLTKYVTDQGYIETRPLDLGEVNSAILRVDALGGRTSNANGNLSNQYAGTAAYRFADASEMRFFIRAADSPYTWTRGDLSSLAGPEWTPFEPGVNLPLTIRGRYVQVAVLFYPSGDGETTPYLDELRVIYRPNNPPRPPAMVTATARDGAVELSWRTVSDPDLAGYLVYYGTASGEYFGSGSNRGPSPIDAGKVTSLRIEGLKNGVLYYFVVAAYDRLTPLHGGEFSREVSARPVRMVE